MRGYRLIEVNRGEIGYARDINVMRIKESTWGKM